MTRSATRWLSRNAPDCCSSRSTSVVLPWSTWAMMAMLRSFMGEEARCGRPETARTGALSFDREGNGGATALRGFAADDCAPQYMKEDRKGRAMRSAAESAGAIYNASDSP